MWYRFFRRTTENTTTGPMLTPLPKIIPCENFSPPHQPPKYCDFRWNFPLPEGKENFGYMWLLRWNNDISVYLLYYYHVIFEWSVPNYLVTTRGITQTGATQMILKQSPLISNSPVKTKLFSRFKNRRPERPVINNMWIIHYTSLSQSVKKLLVFGWQKTKFIFYLFLFVNYPLVFVNY